MPWGRPGGMYKWTTCVNQQCQSSGHIVLVHPRPFWSHQLQLPHKHVYAFSDEQHLTGDPLRPVLFALEVT